MLKRIGFFALLPLFCPAHAGSPESAQHNLSGNIGYQSHYIFRGVPQSRSSAQGGLDYEFGGLYAGTWAADVGMGAEVDVYGGYGWTLGEFTLGLGATGYFYTDDFDDTYTEINLSASYGALDISYNPGRYDNFAGPRQDYSFTSVGFELSGVFARIGMFGGDFDGDFYEVGYGFDVGGIDLSLGVVYSDDKLVSGSSNTNLYFGINKTLGIID